MDTILIKTFLEVVTCNSFAAAAERLFISQSAVSLRIKSLEQQIGRPVFLRSKAGVQVTPAGQRLIRHASSFLQIWEEAKQEVAIPEEFDDVLVIAAEQGMWERLLIRWLPLLAESFPRMAFRAEEGKSLDIIRHMVTGTTDIAVLYTPQLRPGLEIRHLFDEHLILISDKPGVESLESDYVFVDWGEEFTNFHNAAFPDSAHPRITFKLGQVTLNFLLNNGGSAFMPKRLAQPLIDAGRLFASANVPSFTIPVHLAWRAAIENDVLEVVIKTMETISEQAMANTLPPPFWEQPALSIETDQNSKLYDRQSNNQ